MVLPVFFRGRWFKSTTRNHPTTQVVGSDRYPRNHLFQNLIDRIFVKLYKKPGMKETKIH